eukprot:459004-Amorphochlora_amoeboformis.AAC.2
MRTLGRVWKDDIRLTSTLGTFGLASGPAQHAPNSFPRSRLVGQVELNQPSLCCPGQPLGSLRNLKAGTDG